MFDYFLPDEQATLTVGASLAAAIQQPGIVIFLLGPLGAGKTTFSRGFLRGLGYQGKVKSPTYTLVEPYQAGFHKVYHFDFYRLNDPEELIHIGIQDYFSSTTICLIEWPDKGSGFLPLPDIICRLEVANSGRQLQLGPGSLLGEGVLDRFVALYLR